MVLCRIDGNAVQPGIESTFTPKIRQRPVGLDERLLSHIQGFAVIINIAPDQTDDLVLVLFYQQIKSALVTCLYSLYQFLVSSRLTLVRHNVSLDSTHLPRARCTPVIKEYVVQN